MDYNPDKTNKQHLKKLSDNENKTPPEPYEYIKRMDGFDNSGVGFGSERTPVICKPQSELR
jgi:hypothetical protein